MNRDYCVYKHTSPSGKVYIGITRQTPSARWRGGLGYRHNEPFFRAIVKYGWENFTHEILLDGLTRAEACAEEVELIAAHKSSDERYGYNLTTGGEGCAGSKKTDEFRRRQSDLVKDLWENPEYRAHMSRIHSGKKQSPETIERRRVKLIGHQVSEENRQRTRERLLGNTNRARPVLCIETGCTFPTIKAAARWAGISSPVLNRHLRGGRKSAGGYHWQYVEEGYRGSV